MFKDKCCPNATSTSAAVENMKSIITALQNKVQSLEAADVNMKNTIMGQ